MSEQPSQERLPFWSSNDILGMEGVACVLKRDAKIFGVGVAEKRGIVVLG